MQKIDRAIDDLQKGKFVLVYDNDKREGETDFFIASQFVVPQAISQMRKDGGGLIILMISYPISQKLQLPFLSDLYSSIYEKYPILKQLVPNDIPYDTKSSFSLAVNHRETFTGITDNDRSLTMKRFALLSQEIQKLEIPRAMQLFGQEFRSPGHVPICIAADQLLKKRKGHTELMVALLEMAGLVPVGSGCEMMGDTGKALSKKNAEQYAHKHNLVFLEGNDIVEAWMAWSK